MLKRLFLIFAVTLLAGIAGAQDFYHRPSPLAGRTLVTLALFDEVKAELKMTAADNAKVEALLGKMSDDVQASVSGGDFANLRTEIEKVNAKYDEEILKAVSADQATRLKQLFVQFNGNASLSQPWVQKELVFTDDQKAKVKKLQDEQWQKTMEAFQNGPEEAQGVMKKLQEEFKVETGKMLTEDQTKKLKEMEGAKFEFKKVEG